MENDLRKRTETSSILTPMARSATTCEAVAKTPLSSTPQVGSATRRTIGQSIGMSDSELEPFVDPFEHAEHNAAKKLI